MRRMMPRFQPENFEHNQRLVSELDKIAKRKQCSLAQLSLAWVRTLSQRPGMPVIIPLPGATTVARVKENATEVQLSDEDFEEMNAALDRYEVKGDRYPEAHMKHLNG